jgi:hypothetical protein
MLIAKERTFETLRVEIPMTVESFFKPRVTVKLDEIQFMG